MLTTCFCYQVTRNPITYLELISSVSVHQSKLVYSGLALQCGLHLLHLSSLAILSSSRELVLSRGKSSPHFSMEATYGLIRVHRFFPSLELSERFVHVFPRLTMTLDILQSFTISSQLLSQVGFLL